MTRQTATKYVMLYRGSDQEAAARAARWIAEMPGVTILRQSGSALLLVEVATGNIDFHARATAAGEWTVSEQRVYRLS